MVTEVGTGVQVMEQAGMGHMVEVDTKVFLQCIILILICPALQIIFVSDIIQSSYSPSPACPACGWSRSSAGKQSV